MNSRKIYETILKLCFCSKKREVVPELAPMLWHSFGTVAALLQEIINIYPAINPPHLTVSIFSEKNHSFYTNPDILLINP